MRSAVIAGEIAVVKQARLAEAGAAPAVAIVSNEKPGVQAIAPTAPDVPPQPHRHHCRAHDHDSVRHGTLSLLAGMIL